MVNWDSPVGILDPKEFVDGWRILLWEKAFLPILSPVKGAKFVKGIDLEAFDAGVKAINCILYKYFTFLIAILYFTILIAILYFTFFIVIFLLQICPPRASLQGCSFTCIFSRIL